MNSANTDQREHRRPLRALVAACAWATLLASPGYGQTSGETHVVIVEGGGSGSRLSGMAGGGQLLLWNRLGIGGEYGLIVDDSDERSLAPLVSGGASLRLPSRGKVTPFVDAGLARLGDMAGPYVGGGLNYRLRGAAALRVEVRSIAFASASRICATDRLAACDTRGGAWFVRAGVTLGLGG